MPVKRRESSVEKDICDYARELGFLTYKFVSPGKRGVPDRMFISPTGLVCFVEVKRPGASPEPLQLREIRLMNERRSMMACWCDNIDEAKQFLLVNQNP